MRILRFLDNFSFFILILLGTVIPITFSPFSNSTFRVPKFFASIILISLFIAVRLIVLSIKKEVNYPKFICISALLFALFSFISAYFSPLRRMCVLESLIVLFYLIFFISILTFNLDKTRIVILLIMMFLFGLISITYSIFQMKLKDPIFFAVSELKSLADLRKYATPVGFNGNPNDFASYFAPLIIIAFGLIFYLKKLHKYIFILSIPPMLFVLYFTFCRSATISMAIGVIVLIFYYLAYYRKIISPHLLLGLMVIVVSISIYALFYVHKKFIPYRLSRTFGYNSLRNRIDCWKDSTHMIKDKIWFGWGIGAYKTVFPKTYQKHNVKYETLQAHNEYVQLMCEIGVVGIYFFIFLFFYFLLNI